MATTPTSPKPCDATLDLAARRLASSATPLFAGLGVDVDGARAAVALAERLGGALDHMHAGAVLRDLDAMRESGALRTTPTEARLRADTVLVVGAVEAEALRRLVDAPLRHPAQGPRVVHWLLREGEAAVAGVAAHVARVAAADLPIWLAALRAEVKGRSVAGFAHRDAARRLAQALKAARFGVALWSAAHLCDMEIEALNGLLRDLNETTRFDGLPLAQGDNALGVLAACGWTTGFPTRTGFGPQGPEHDPWRFDAARMIAQGESDCVVWLSAFGAPPPRAMQQAVAIAICDDVAGWETPPPIHLAIGRPGRDHDGVLYDDEAGALIATTARAPRDLPGAASILAALAARIDALANSESAWPC